jgi:RNA polymerase sigma factor (sigma-70 family)
LESPEKSVVIGPKYKSLTDSELVSLCLQGDTQAWEALIVRYKRLIYSIPVRFGLSSADASDVFQAVCLKLIEHLQGLKDETKVSAWLITTTTRQCIHLKSLRQREPGAEEDYEEPPDPADDLEALRIQTEEQQTVREAVEQLPQRCRALLELLYFDPKALSYDEISENLNIPVASIGPTRARCLEKLKTLLRRRGIK